MIAQIVTGDGALFTATLKRNGETFNIPTDYTVKAAVVSANRSTVLIAAQEQSSSETGADWSASLVGIRFSIASTNITTYGIAILEVEVDDGTNPKETYFSAINIVKGNIA